MTHGSELFADTTDRDKDRLREVLALADRVRPQEHVVGCLWCGEVLAVFQAGRWPPPPAHHCEQADPGLTRETATPPRRDLDGAQSRTRTAREDERSIAMTDALVKADEAPLALRHELTVEEVVTRIHKVHQAMEKAMVDGHHYGIIPGTTKPTLFKPGAELLLLMFRLDPEYSAVELRDGEHLTVTSTCTLWHIPTGQRAGSGQGSCSTRESKYAWRDQGRRCPACGTAAIIKGRAEYGGGWLCFKKKDGCGAKYKDGDAQIEAQPVGRVPNPDLPDAYNTVLKMANKRSLVAAVLNVTAASDIFTQDLEDLPPTGPAPAAAASDSLRDPAPAAAEPPDDVGGLHQRKAEALGRISAGMDMLKLSAKERVAIWDKHLPGVPLLTDHGELIHLEALLGELRTRHRAQQTRSQ